MILYTSKAGALRTSDNFVDDTVHRLETSLFPILGSIVKRHDILSWESMHTKAVTRLAVRRTSAAEAQSSQTNAGLWSSAFLAKSLYSAILIVVHIEPPVSQ
jgi:hypothetical protein